MLFSKRMGFKKIEDVIFVESLPIPLRKRLKNILYQIFEKNSNRGNHYGSGGNHWELYRFLIEEFFKEDIQSKKDSGYIFSVYYKDVVSLLDKMEWYSYYDILELIGEVGLITPDIKDKINYILNEQQSGYRLSEDNLFIPLTDEVAISTIDSASESTFMHAREHINKALKELSDKRTKDYNSVIRETINSVESCLIEIAGLSTKDKNTLGKAVKAISKKHPELELSFFKPFEQLYGIASNNGIRHAGNENTLISDLPDAILVLTTCSAIINYLSVKIEKL